MVEDPHPSEAPQARPLLGRHQATFDRAVAETRAAWPGLTTYERFEQIVTLVLTALIALVILAAVVNLTFRIIMLVLFGLLDPAEHSVFQAIFGMIFTVLIALEFNHSIIGVLERKESIVQVRTVVLIAILALVRKFIILDATKTEPLTIIGLAAAVLALGGVYWLVREQERRAVAALPAPPAAPTAPRSGGAAKAGRKRTTVSDAPVPPAP